MKITAIQTDIHWEDPLANREAIDKQLDALKGDEDIIVLPEMFNTGFSNKPETLAEDMNGDTMEWLRDQTKAHDAVICGSMMMRDIGGFFNRMIWMRPDNIIESYNKRHLFSMAKEGDHFRAGREQKIVEWKGMRFCLQICYDLRFPVWSRNEYVNGDYAYDCLIYVANWPSPRANAWRDLLRARSIENISYCIGVNRTGTDANKLDYLGDSVILDFMGHDMTRANEGEERITADLDHHALLEFRKRFPVGLDADRFKLEL